MLHGGQAAMKEKHHTHQDRMIDVKLKLCVGLIFLFIGPCIQRIYMLGEETYFVEKKIIYWTPSEVMKSFAQ